VISSNEAFSPEELPKRVVIQGGGYIALEFAGIFAGLRSDVTVIYRRENILRGFDERCPHPCPRRDGKKGITIITATHQQRSTGTARNSRRICPTGRALLRTRLMFAIGRHPNVANLGLKTPASAINPENGGNRGRRLVEDVVAKHLRHRRCHPSSQPDAGAIREGHAFADTVFGNRPVKVDHATIPTAVFSQPESARSD